MTPGEPQQATREPRRPAVEPGNGETAAEVKLLNEPRSVAEAEAKPDTLVIAGTTFRSRLIVGTGKYSSNEVMVKALRASGAQMITVAVRRVDLDRSREEGVLHHLDPHEFFLLANTAGCYTADEAVRYARLARSAGFNEWLKLADSWRTASR
jgi:hypothetical protein